MKNFVLVILAVLCFAPVFSFAGNEKIKVGSILILSGENAEYGVQARRGAEIALDEINQNGGVNGKKLEFIWEDEAGGKAERAVAAYKKLTAVDRVSYIFGPSFQDGMMAVAPLAKKDNLFILTPSTPSLSLPGVFSTWIDPKVEADLIADHILKKFKKVSILAAQQSWELMVAEAFKKRIEETGGTVSSYADPLNTTLDLKPEVLAVRRAQPDAVFISSYTLFPRYVKELRQQGITVPIFTIEADNSVINAAGSAAEGVISIGPSVPETDFKKKYETRYQSVPDNPSYQAYDAVKMLADAIGTYGEGTPNVSKYFKSFKSYQGVSGTITNVDGNTLTSTAFFIVRNGKLEKMSDGK